MKTDKIKGQGAVANIHNHFIKNRYEKSIYDDDFEETVAKTEILEVFPKSIVNPVKSPDLRMAYSMNPYQGCEHGCAYCFARPTHEYWGYSAGVDFERKILVKKNAPELLEQFFKKRGYKPEPILLSGNTDCYQPIERKLEITRKILQVFLDYRHPVDILTKNALVTRDLDILTQLAEKNLVSVSLSIPTINEELRRKLEPRTSSVNTKLQALETLSKNGIPTHVMVAPIIPGLNSMEILNTLKVIAEKGAKSFGYTLVRLNDTVEPIFIDWLEEHYPDRKEKVLNHIASMHGGKLGEKNVAKRKKGEGNIAEMIHTTFRIGRQKFFTNEGILPLATNLFDGTKGEQLRLF
ncbi:PA0069 family radical SAM protein [Flavobacterium subsaxonicum]|uniref:Radical SAM protein n=1 Tax=Flavobacterium subsaxonicum WB 4.1-42 = DSM 21790 TaxID=1121898 RepID=A0A0A2MJ18_9FLAO|nr:PA0069 family radical SAM protein [Flavobacterium subsaxonicum]KGO91576.1 radical SAM protein [Flavobacterium subsaxonicum WB 4.1-42 = DSM 21790]